jgi:myosin heavy subunit
MIFVSFYFSAIVEKYLLEKSRIVSQAKNERFVFTVY